MSALRALDRRACALHERDMRREGGPTHGAGRGQRGACREVRSGPPQARRADAPCRPRHGHWDIPDDGVLQRPSAAPWGLDKPWTKTCSRVSGMPGLVSGLEAGLP